MLNAPYAGFSDAADDFAYGSSHDVSGLRMKVSIFADRPHLRDQMREDAEGAGFRLAQASPIAHLLSGEAMPLGDVVLLDCPVVDGEVLAALSRLDLRAGHTGAALVVSTSVDALDDVFGCLDQSDPQILVNPSRAERLIALGQVMARMPAKRVRELSDEDRMVLLRLTEQVTQIGERLNTLTPGMSGAATQATPAQNNAAFRFDGIAKDPAGDKLVNAPRPQMPDPRMVRRIIRQRQMRARFFDGDLFADPAWDMLLDLTAAHVEKAKVSVTSLCIASSVPPTTALRWIGQMTEAGLLKRIEDESDRRRAFITLTDKAADAMAGYFADLGNSASRAV
ncbi:DNA-binding response OmpR family regulator [Novosphingobium sp. SG751A]|uniref:winged helix DNA-binding protein n=1 Tax=Novosphingobium sp. SG751A TaxID=2587000 RepID=UPI001556B28E|nr:winged helix DNA-binding protein [Novosphingobium sp. SG751A]NOW47637.1 DNA-binding response OmpR family regulator [Novosphingobium sp. SG751A]